jgi:transcriptional regulator with XRE-family HTH domain
MEYNINMEKITYTKKAYMEKQYMQKFSERLKDLRTEKKLSIQGLSSEIKIGVASICRWENQQADVSASQLIVLAKFFDVSVDYLLGLED